MMTFGLIALGVLLAAAFVVLIGAAARAPEGYEDAAGFHPGALPRPAPALEAVALEAVALEAVALEAVVLEAAVRERRRLTPVALGAVEPCRSDHAHRAC